MRRAILPDNPSQGTNQSPHGSNLARLCLDSQIRGRPALTEHRDGISFAEITNTIRRSWGSAVPERRGARWRRASVGGGAPRPRGAAPSEWGEESRGPLFTLPRAAEAIRRAAGGHPAALRGSWRLGAGRRGLGARGHGTRGRCSGKCFRGSVARGGEKAVRWETARWAKPERKRVR